MNDDQLIHFNKALVFIFKDLPAAFAVCCDYFGAQSTVEEFQQNYCGVYESEVDFVKEQFEADGTMKKIEELLVFADSYVNWSAVAL